MDIWLDVPTPVKAVLPRRVWIPFGRALTIGRSTEADIVVSHSFGDHLYCEVGRDGCGAWIRDLGSRNGTFVKGTRIGDAPHRLLPNDGISLTDFLIRVTWDFEVLPYWLRWEAGVVVSLAHRVRDEGDQEAMPILADALEDAGCTDAGILEHLRGPGPHVRECWVIEALLGRS
jgi:FHA domain